MRRRACACARSSSRSFSRLPSAPASWNSSGACAQPLTRSARQLRVSSRASASPLVPAAGVERVRVRVGGDRPHAVGDRGRGRLVAAAGAPGARCTRAGAEAPPASASMMLGHVQRRRSDRVEVDPVRLVAPVWMVKASGARSRRRRRRGSRGRRPRRSCPSPVLTHEQRAGGLVDHEARSWGRRRPGSLACGSCAARRVAARCSVAASSTETLRAQPGSRRTAVRVARIDQTRPTRRCRADGRARRGLAAAGGRARVAARDRRSRPPWSVTGLRRACWARRSVFGRLIHRRATSGPGWVATRAGDRAAAALVLRPVARARCRRPRRTDVLVADVERARAGVERPCRSGRPARRSRRGMRDPRSPDVGAGVAAASRRTARASLTSTLVT